MKRANRTILILLLLVFIGATPRVRYFLNEHDFISNKPVPASEIFQKSHIRAEYDNLDRLVIKAHVNRDGTVLKREYFKYVDTAHTIRQKDYYDVDENLVRTTIFGRETQSLSYIEYVFGVDSVKKWDDRFTTGELNSDQKPINYRFFDVDAFEYGGMEFDYDSLGRMQRQEWFRRPDGKSMRNYLYKFYPGSDITHIFEYDSNGVLVMDVKLTPDGTEVVFSFILPKDSTYINTSTISYGLGSNLKWGHVDWIMELGADSFRVDLEDLTKGRHTLKLHSDSVLTDSAVYAVLFSGEGSKGYFATDQKINNLTYDISPPLLTLEVSPFINLPEIAFSATEPLDSAFLVWLPDSIFKSVSRDTISFGRDELLLGNTSKFSLRGQTDLTDGTRYTVRLYAIDRAGNLSLPALSDSIIYDVSPSRLSILYPEKGEWINHQQVTFQPYENLQHWQITVEWQGGDPDMKAPYSAEFPDTITAVLETVTDLSPYFQLLDGAVYSLALTGVDLAGNISDTVRVDSIHYDVSAPELTMIFPYDEAPINNTSVSYTMDEPLQVGEFRWAATGGTPDSLSPHIVELLDDELIPPEKIHINLQNEPSLIDGAIYTITLTGRDLAGNESDPIIVKKILYDASSPVFSNVKPDSGTALNHLGISYEISENLRSGIITWVQTGGEEDIDTPHIIALQDEELKGGFHNNITLLNLPNLHDGTVYSLQFSGIDPAGNVADTVTVDDILYDFSPPEMIIDFPKSRTLSRTKAMTYTLSEDLYDASMRWIWLGGVPDSLAPYKVELTLEERQAGEHIDRELANTPELMENALYTLIVSGQDRAGNRLKRIMVPGLQYDFTLPEITWHSPVNGAAVNHKNIHYEISELLERCSITWTRVGGVEDIDSPHVSELAGAELFGQEHTDILLLNNPNLVDGAIYDLTIIGYDPAGNVSNTVLITGVLYDFTPPEIIIAYPRQRSISNTTAMTYTLSENLYAASMRWIWLGGVPDSLAPYKVELTLDEKQAGEHIDRELANTPELIENALYTLMVNGRDRAGNTLKRAIIPGLQYDFSAPEFTWHTPLDGSAINHARINYKISELLKHGSITWTWVSGTQDPDSPHLSELSGDELFGKEHTNVKLINSPSLVDGAVYELNILGVDPAGNETDTVVAKNVEYDVSAPVLSFIAPGSGIFTTETNLTYSLSENIYNGQIIWEVSGSKGEGLIVSFDLTEEASKAGEHFSDDYYIPDLVDGVTYVITLSGQDRAGNVGKAVKLSNYRIDRTPPVFSNLSPLSGTFINQLNFGWTLSEDIAEGNLIVEQPDAEVSFTITLDGDELRGKARIPGLLTNMVDLQDGKNYSFSLVGSDFAGNLSDTVSVSNINYDISSPQLTIVTPVNNDHIRVTEILYSTNEQLAVARMIWESTDGEKRSYDLREVHMQPGEYVLMEYGVELPENVPLSLVIEGMDRAGNKAISDTVKNLIYDGTPPKLAILSPVSGEAVNHTRLSINFSEDLAEGSLRWEAVRGNDSGSPHLSMLRGNELIGGDYSDFIPVQAPNLKDGVAYNITIEGTDLAGNVGEPMTVENVLYDVTPPVFADIMPLPGAYVNEVNLSYTLSENLKEGRIIFKYSGGALDPQQAHVVNLAGKRKKKGQGGGKLPQSLVSLVSGATYNIHFEGVDSAGNFTPETVVNSITFDDKVPILGISQPLTSDFVNNSLISYSISEDLQQAGIELERVGGIEDSQSPRTIILTEAERAQGMYSDVDFKGLGKWVDGAVYSLRFTGNDQAGNVADPVLIDFISYDITPPVITIEKPLGNNKINYQTLSYTLSENLAEAEAIFTRIGGAVDGRSPQTVKLIGNELARGIKQDILFSNGPSLVNGSQYKIELAGVDYAGNVSSTVVVENIGFDNEPPEITISMPIDGEQIKKTDITYMLSDDLSWGEVVFTQIGGTPDPNSPHKVALTGDQLRKGMHADVALNLEKMLADGGHYSIILNGADRADNIAKVTGIKDVLFDVLPPRLSFTGPTSGTAINSTMVSFSTSEEMGKGSFIFTRIGGVEDMGSPHIISLSGDQLKQGEHVDLALDVPLQDGSLYSIELNGEDLAGNISDPVSISNILYDVTAPVIKINNPAENSFHRSIRMDFALNEALSTGKIIMERRGGVLDPASPREYVIKGDFLLEGSFTDINLNDLLSPVSGTIYILKMEGSDLAGNSAITVEIASITFDDTPPDLAITTPKPGSYINATTLGLRTNEILASAKIEWIWVDGNPDPAGTHESILSGEILQDGNYPEVDFDPKPALVVDAKYKVIFHGTDRAGNENSYTLSSVFFDDKPPTMTGILPLTNGFVHNPNVSYELDEPILQATLTWISADNPDGVVVNLVGSELDPGTLPVGILSNQKDLTDGTVYTLVFQGEDRAGNEATITLAENITYDVTKPKFSQLFPNTGFRVNSPLIKWTIDEPLQSGKYTWIHMGGKEDPNAPHVVEFTDDLLMIGSYDNSSLPVLSLVTDAMYRITLEGTDLADNTGKKFIMSIVYDDISPTLNIDYPLPFSAVNNTNIAYNLSESLSNGQFVYTQIAGETDPNSPVIVELTGRELETNLTSPKDLKNPPVLHDGSIYSITFKGRDLAQNESASPIVDSVKYDVTRPIITIFNPEPDKPFMGIEISIDISEDLKDGKMVWTRTGGLKDKVLRHYIPLYDIYLKQGKYPEAKLPLEKTLSAGVIYSLSVDAQDFAGNKAQPISIEGIEYIRSMAGNWYYKGAIIEVIWAFEPDPGKNTVSGKFTQGLSLGTKISNQETGRYSFDFTRKPWTLTLEMDNPEKNRISLFEFLGKNRMRVITGTKKPRNWYDGETMEYEWRP